MQLTFHKLYNDKLGHLCNPEHLCSICEKDSNQIDYQHLILDPKAPQASEHKNLIAQGLLEAFQSKNKDSITGLIKQQHKAQLKYLSDLDLFKYLVKKEQFEIDITHLNEKISEYQKYKQIETDKDKLKLIGDQICNLTDEIAPL